jgi:hypothetical protein
MKNSGYRLKIKKPPHSVDLDKIYKSLSIKYNLPVSTVKKIFISNYRFLADSIRAGDKKTIRITNIARFYFCDNLYHRKLKKIQDKKEKFNNDQHINAYQ